METLRKKSPVTGKGSQKVKLRAKHLTAVNMETGGPGTRPRAQGGHYPQHVQKGHHLPVVLLSSIFQIKKN